MDENVKTTPETDKLLTLDDVVERMSCSKSIIYRYVRENKIPPPIRMGSHYRWKREVIDQWIEAGMPRNGEVE